MKRTALAAALVCAAVAYGCPAFADGPIQMLPPTPLGSTVACPAGLAASQVFVVKDMWGHLLLGSENVPPDMPPKWLEALGAR
jgi:hypothetical protein